MYKLMSNNYARMKCISLMIALCPFYFHISQAAFPLERDVREIVGISQPKRWIVFMERRASKCLSDMVAQSPTSLVHAFRCMIHSGVISRCLMRFYEPPCILIQKYPNILKFADHNNLYFKKSIQVVVHREFTVNITMVQCNMPTVLWNGLGYIKMYFEIAENKFKGPHPPVTVITLHNAVTIKFNTGQSYSAVIKFDVVQKLGMTDHPQMRENAMYFPWGDFLVTCFQIKVDVKARLSLGIITCMACNALVYDRPNERLPIIMKIRNISQAQRVVGSTFQVYLVITDYDYQQKSHMTYVPIYRKTAAFNLSRNEYHILSFDNNTHCYGHSFSARLCVYTYYTTNSEKMRFTLTDLNFKGKYEGSNFAAGVFLFDTFGETVVKLMEFNRDLPSIENTDFEIIGTKMQVAIFVYSDFASLSLKFSMSKTNCNILLASKTYISYSGYILPVEDTTHVFHVNQPSQDFSEYDDCFQFQFLAFEFEITIKFPQNTQVLMATNGYKFDRKNHHPCRTDIKAFAGEYHVKNMNGEYLDRQKIVSFIKYLNVSECFPNTYMQIRIKWLPCKLPCRYLDLKNTCYFENDLKIMWHDNDNDTCDICEKIYASCDPVLLKNNVSISIGLKPKLCLSLDLTISNPMLKKSPSMGLALNNNNMISRIPDFAGLVYAWVSSNKCVMEIPTAALNTDDRYNFQKQNVVLDAVKAAYRGDVLYYRLSSLRLVSWEEAARYCHDIEAFLLTIHSLEEYQFIKETFLQSHDTLVLYVGLKRKVIKVMNW